MSDERIVLDANLGRTNVISFDDFSSIAIDTLEEIIDTILPLCGSDALHDLVIYRNLATDFASNVFSNDGIHILKNMEHLSPIQIYITNYIRYIAERVERAAADGTSTAIYLASTLIVGIIEEIQHIRTNAYNDPDDINIYRNIMSKTNAISNNVIYLLDELLAFIKRIKFDVNEVSKECKNEFIYKLAHTTSKQNDTLTDFTVELFSDLPEMLYEHTTYRRSQIETNEDFTVERPEYDYSITVLPSNNTKYNEKLGTELYHENCDLLICPSLFGRVGYLLQYLSEREIDPIEKDIPLVILYTGGDDSENVKLETSVNKDIITVCRQTVYNPVFVNNPLELKIIQAMAGVDPIIQLSTEEFKQSVIKDVRIRLHGKDLLIYDLFSKETLPLHPSYVQNTHPEYTKLQKELEERISTLKASHNRKNMSGEIDEFVRLYRNMICSKLPILTIGGSTIDHLANINVVDDVLGVVSVAMKNGVIIDLMPKFHHAVQRITTEFIEYELPYAIHFEECIEDFCRLTYKNDDICSSFSKVTKDTVIRDSMFVDNHWVKFTEDNASEVVVVQSYKAIEETLLRLKETVPRITCTDRIIVPNGVVSTKQE